MGGAAGFGGGGLGGGGGAMGSAAGFGGGGLGGGGGAMGTGDSGGSLRRGRGPMVGGMIPPASKDDVFKVITLKKMKAPDAGAIVEQLFPGQIGVVVDQTSNSLIIRNGEAAVIEKVEALLSKLEDLPRTDDSRPKK